MIETRTVGWEGEQDKAENEKGLRNEGRETKGEMGKGNEENRPEGWMEVTNEGKDESKE